MRKKKYNYNKDLIIFSLLKPPVVLPILPVMQFFMKSFYLADKHDKKLKKEKITIPLSDGGKINAFIYTPVETGDEETPCIIFYHGGGFVYNAAPHHFTLAKNLAKALGVRVVFPDYRLAPAYPFPAAVSDAFDSYCYISKNAEHFCVDKNRIALCGDSAGGNLSAVVALMCRDRKVTPPCAQVLLYPFVDVNNESDSMLEFTDTPMCNSKDAAKYKKAYIPDENYGPVEWFSIVDAKNLSDMPETYIETAEFDCLRDGGVKYYNKLKEWGNKVYLNETKGTMHGYDIAVKSEVYASCMKKRIDFLRKAFQ